MEKILICFLFIFFISIQQIDSLLIFRHFNIQISNQLGGNKQLMINCRSGKQQATKVDFLPFNTVWTLKFTVFPKTLIWCNVWMVISNSSFTPNYIFITTIVSSFIYLKYIYFFRDLTMCIMRSLTHLLGKKVF